VREISARIRPFLLVAGVFSLAINLLLLAPPLYMLQVFDRVLGSRSIETLAVLTLAAGGALLAGSLLDLLRARLLLAAGAVLDRALGPRVLEGLLEQAARLGGAAQAAALRDVGLLRAFFNGQGLVSVFDAPWLPLFLALIFLFHPLLGAVALAGAAAMLVLAWANERFTRAALGRAQAEARRAARCIDAGVRNADVASALGMLPALTRRWAALNDGALVEQLRSGGTGAGFAAATRFTRQVVQIAMLAAGAWLVLAQDLTAGVMIAATLILGRALAPVETVVAGWKSLTEARGAWRRLEALLSAARAQARTELPPPTGKLEMEHVVFAHAGAARPALRGVSFVLAPGEALGVIGPSASGKSTLARLAVGVWQPGSGAVRLDGAELGAWPRERLGAYLGYLPQDVELFAGTVAENIARMGVPHAAAVVRAAERAHAHALIVRLPRGYDTEVGEFGRALSPGQRQRIALARALYSEAGGSPRLVVLDEPNANLDHEGDEALVRALAALKGDGVSVIVVAHRPSLLRGVERLLVLREGALDMLGPRAEVMARLTRAVPPAREVA
jgi:PrtD family type I secretion system ABC transporter